MEMGPNEFAVIRYVESLGQLEPAQEPLSTLCVTLARMLDHHPATPAQLAKELRETLRALKESHVSIDALSEALARLSSPMDDTTNT